MKCFKRKCVRCGKEIISKATNRIYCGSQSTKDSCSWIVGRQKSKERNRLLREVKKTHFLIKEKRRDDDSWLNCQG